MRIDRMECKYYSSSIELNQLKIFVNYNIRFEIETSEKLKEETISFMVSIHINDEDVFLIFFFICLLV